MIFLPPSPLTKSMPPKVKSWIRHWHNVIATGEKRGQRRYGHYRTFNGYGSDFSGFYTR